MDSPQFLSLVWQASWVVQLAMLILVVLSLWTWYVFVWKFIITRRSMKKCQQFSLYYQKKEKRSSILQSLRARQNQLTELDKLYVRLTENFRSLCRIHPHQMDFIINRLEKISDQCIRERIEQLTPCCSSLATIATTAPFIGLLGTVFGVINVFDSLGQSAQINLATIAPGIAETLLATALGLIAAIPAAIFYNFLVGRITRISETHEKFSSQLISELSHYHAEDNGAPPTHG